MPSFKTIIKRLWSKAVLGAVIFIVPAYAIKWGQLHPHTNWSKYLASAWSVGILNSPLGHSEFYGAHFHWQELACLLIYVAVWLQAEYLLVTYGPEDLPRAPFPRTRQAWRAYFLNREQALITATMVFVFLYVAACALCERIQMGTIFGITKYESYLRDSGIIIETYLLFQTIHVLSRSIRFNGMIVRSDLSRIYFLYIGSLAGLSLAFCDWFPLLALPGARIATTWIFTALRENADVSSEAIEPEIIAKPGKETSASELSSTEFGATETAAKKPGTEDSDAEKPAASKIILSEPGETILTEPDA